MSKSIEKIVVAGGCFWCLEAVFRIVRGVVSVRSGYTGGSTENPSYEDVCRGNTGHVEAVEISFDPSVISRDVILNIFFGVHDPTTPDQQSHDIGTQYASVVFFETEEEQRAIIRKIRSLEEAKTFSRPIVTAVRRLGEFYPAEPFHDRYYEKNPEQSYCRFVIDPKIAKFREKFSAWLEKPNVSS